MSEVSEETCMSVKKVAMSLRRRSQENQKETHCGTHCLSADMAKTESRDSPVDDGGMAGQRNTVKNNQTIRLFIVKGVVDNSRPAQMEQPGRAAGAPLTLQVSSPTQRCR